MAVGGADGMFEFGVADFADDGSVIVRRAGVEIGARDVGGNETPDGAEDESHTEPEAGARFTSWFEANADDRRGVIRMWDGRGALVDGNGEFDDGPVVGADDALAPLELAPQTYDHDGIVNVRDFADESAGDDAFVTGTGVDDDDFGPRGAAVDPLVVIDIADGWVEREAASSELLQGRGERGKGHPGTMIALWARYDLGYLTAIFDREVSAHGASPFRKAPRPPGNV